MMAKYKWVRSILCACVCVWSGPAMAWANVQPIALREMMLRDVYPAEWMSRPWHSVVPRLAPTALEGAYERAPISWLTSLAPKSTPSSKKPTSGKTVQPAAETGSKMSKASKAAPKASKANENEFVPIELGTVAVSPEVGVTLTRVTALSVDKIKTFYFTFLIKNRSSKEFDFGNYWFSVQGADGAQYKPRLVEATALTNPVPVRSERQVEVYIQAPKSVSGFSLKIALFRWNFTRKDFQEPIGTYAIPKTYKNVAPSNKTQRLSVNEVPLRMSIDKTTVSEDEKYKYVNVSMKIKNTGVIKSSGGAIYSMKLLTNKGLQFDLSGSITLDVPPQDEAEFPLNGRVPQSVDLRNAQLMLVKSISPAGNAQGKEGAAAASGTLMPVAIYMLDYKPRVGAFVAVGKSVRLEVDSKPIIANVKSAVSKPTGKKTDADGKKQSITVSLIAKNDGREFVTLPYKYRLKTASGEFYDLNPSGSGGQTTQQLLPKIPQQIDLTANIPVTTSLKNIVLLVTEGGASGGGRSGEGQGTTASPTGSTGELRIPVATFALSFREQAERASSETFSYSDEQFAYDVRINDVDRLPFNDGNDYVFVVIDVTNRGTSDAPMPGWTGSLLFDGITRNSVSLESINTGRVNAIRPGETVQMTYRAAIPFARTYQKLTIKIVDGPAKTADPKDATSANENEVLLAVDTRKGGNALLSPAQTKYVVMQEGIRSEVNVIGTRLYQGKSDDTLVTLMEWTNLEQRSMMPTGLYAFYRTDKGAIALATIDHKSTDRVEPQGKTLLSVKGNVPKNVKRETLQLFVGVGTKDKGIDYTSADPSDGYIALRPMALNNETVEPKQSLMNIVVKPYTVSIQKYKLTPTDGTNFTAEMTVRVEQSKEYTSWPRDRKLIFEVTDLFSGAKVEKEIQIDASGGENFAVGTQERTIPFSGITFQSFQSYSLRIYEAVDRSGAKEGSDNRKLLLSEFVGRWFTQY